MDYTGNENLKFEVYQELGECYTHTGDFDKAFKYFEEAKIIDTMSERPFVGIGVAEMQKSEINNAKLNFIKASEMNLNCDKAFAGLAMTYTTIGDNNEALINYKHALDIDPSNKAALMGLMQCAYSFQKYDVVVEYLNKYLDHYPGNLQILYCLAGTYFKQDKFIESKEVIERIFIFEPNHIEASKLNELVNKEIENNLYSECENT
jgi:tetratricopeptide (TPR) repeat protein